MNNHPTKHCPVCDRAMKPIELVYSVVYDCIDCIGPDGLNPICSLSPEYDESMLGNMNYPQPLEVIDPPADPMYFDIDFFVY